jgi:tetratricopeptide (TPR) repeat protein
MSYHTTVASQCLAMIVLLWGSILGAADRPLQLNASQRQVLAKCQQLLAERKHADAKVRLSTLRDQVGPGHPGVDVAVAALYAAEGKFARAQKLIDRYVRDRTTYRPAWAEAYLLQARIDLDASKTTDALRLFNWIATNENEKDPLLQVRAAIGVGECLECLGRPQAARRAWTFALGNLTTLRRAKPQTHTKSQAQTTDVLIKQVRQQLAGLTRADDAEPVSDKAFVLYRDAETLRLRRRNPAAALAKYVALQKKFPQTIYAEAAKLYGATCLVQIGTATSVAAARKLLLAWMKQGAEFDAYRGEAMLLLGRLELEHTHNVHRAGRWFQSADQWIASVRNHRRDGRDTLNGLRGVRPTTLASVRAPKTQRIMIAAQDRIDQPGQLINRQTAPWYLDDLEARCAAVRGLLLFIAGNDRDAMKHIERLPKLDPRFGGKHVLTRSNPYTRLKFGVEQGHLIAKPVELARFNSQQQMMILLGDFYFITDRYDRCAAVHRQLASNKLSSAQMDLVHYMQGLCLFADGPGSQADRRQHAIKAMLKTLAKTDNTWAEHRAAFKIGQMSRQATDPALRHRGQQLLETLARSDRHTAYTHEARLMLSVDLIDSGQLTEARSLLRRIPARDKLWHQSAARFLEAMDDPRSPLWKMLGKSPPPKRPMPTR